MKWLIQLLMLFACLCSMAQSPSFIGGNHDGFTSSFWGTASLFNYYKGGSNDGVASSTLYSPNAFSLYKGGSSDGFAFSDGYSPLALNFYKGGTADGFAHSHTFSASTFSPYTGGGNDGHASASLSSLSAFSIYTGGSSDGFALSGISTASAFNFYKGGSNDGFAWSDGHSPAAINLYRGGAEDGFARSHLGAALAFNIYKGGWHDGSAFSAQAAPTALNFYKGGIHDGFAASRFPNPVCYTVTGVSMNVSVSGTSATLSWTSTNSYSSAVLQVENLGNSSVTTYSVPPSAIVNRSYTVSGLIPGHNYRWSVQEWCGVNESAEFSPYQNFSVGAPSDCAIPSNLGIYTTFNQVMIGKWNSVLYGNSSKRYQVSFGINITDPVQGTLGGNTYHITQTPAHATHYFATGNQPGFTWYVRDICSAGDTSAWAGPYVVGTAKTDGAIYRSEDNIVPVALHFNIKVYPNPASGRIVNISVDGEEEELKLKILDMRGAEVLNSTLSDSINTIDVSGLSSGTYVIKVSGSTNAIAQRLVIER